MKKYEKAYSTEFYSLTTMFKLQRNDGLHDHVECLIIRNVQTSKDRLHDHVERLINYNVQTSKNRLHDHVECPARHGGQHFVCFDL